MSNNGLKILLINGPSRAGKDTMAVYLRENWLTKAPKPLPKYGRRIIFERMSRPLKTMFAALVNKPYDIYFNVAYYEQHKEDIIPELGVSFRQFQINMSELHMKPVYGQDVFGRMLHLRLNNAFNQPPEEIMAESGGFASKNPDDTLVLIPDCGFTVEVDYLTQFYADNMLLVRLHRQGCTYAGDSRSYVYSDRIASVDIICDAGVEETHACALELATNFEHFLKIGRGEDDVRICTSEFKMR